MEFNREIIINKPIEAAWEILGNQFGEAYKWARGLKHSNAYGQPVLAGASCNNRACDTTQGKIKEVIRNFDPDNYRLSYEVIEGFPFFVESGVNNWQLIPQGKMTQVKMHLVIKTKGLMGAILGPLMKMQMNKLTTYAIEDFKHFVETGNPSPEKVKEMKKYGLRVA